MSDRHSAGKRFNELILDFRAKILPTITENWDQLSDSQQEQLTRIKSTCTLARINNFFVDFILLLDWLMQLKKQLSCGNLIYY